MGTWVDFHKIREDDLEVEYAFGAPTLDRRLIITKATRTATPMDGNEDSKFSHAVMGIGKRHHFDGVWPEKGTWAS